MEQLCYEATRSYIRDSANSLDMNAQLISEKWVWLSIIGLIIGAKRQQIDVLIG